MFRLVLIGIGEEVDKLSGCRAELPDSVGTGQGGGVKQDTACTGCLHGWIIGQVCIEVQAGGASVAALGHASRLDCKGVAMPCSMLRAATPLTGVNADTAYLD